MMGARARLASLVAGIAATMLAGAATAEPVQWKMHIVWVPSRPEATSMKEFADKATELSAGTLKITVYDSGSLGLKDVDMLRILPDGGTVQVVGLSPAYLSRDVPELPYALPVGVLPTPEDVLKVQPALEKIYREIYDRHGIRLAGLVTSPVRTTHVWCREPINTLATLKGKKLRVWGKFQVDTFAKLGVPAQIIPQNDLYLAMQTGVVDCAIYPLAFAPTISLQEVVKNVAYLHPYADPPLGVVVSEKAFKALPAKAQQAVVEAGKWITKRTADQLAGGVVLDQQAAEKVRPQGVNIMAEFPKADQEAYLKASREVWLALSKATGAKAVANHDAVMAEIEKK
ncbi:MAG: TRAP transporter substrate-binding protein DctP [Alphaproteobacteria bacterium]|nr:TRAP transporter substrate-binding protein DctP [Alphaproteobacteria bacterium]